MIAIDISTIATDTQLQSGKDHPLWANQVELERGMIRDGVERFKAKVTDAKERGQMTRLDPVRGLIGEHIEGVAKDIKRWMKNWSGGQGSSAGHRPISLEPLRSIDPEVAVLIALRACLDGLTLGRVKVGALASAIGRTVEHEVQIRAWEANNEGLFYAAQKTLDDRESTATFRRRFNINQFNDLMAKGLLNFHMEKWPEVVHFRVGLELLNAIVRVTGWFEYGLEWEGKGPKGGSAAPRVLVPKPHVVEWLRGTLAHAEEMRPTFRPTIIPPKRWEGTRTGGYWTPYIRVPKLIRFKASQMTQRERAADEYEALDMPLVYKALHFLQEVPWRVNTQVLAVVDSVITLDLGIAGIPVAAPKERPPMPPGFIGGKEEKGDRWRNVDPVEQKAWRRAATAVHAWNAKSFSNHLASDTTVRIAREYAQYPQFYFPHMLDFRGRMYPIPVALQPQGTDLARGLLEFAEGKPIEDEEGAGWLAIQLASTWEGWDKLTFDDRIAKVFDNEAQWRAIVADPLGCLAWATTDKPWQALAAIHEWVAFLDEGYGYVSHLPVSVDGTCNGIQHLSAMTRDEVAGEYVNLVPGDSPKDIYKHVAEALQETLEKIIESGTGEEGLSLPAQLAAYWLHICEGTLPRTLTKRQVMVLPYGGTKDSYITYTREWLDKYHPQPSDASDEERKARTQRVMFLVGHMWDAVNRVIPGAMTVMQWLKDCAKVAAGGNQPIYWRTPSGFVVRHFYGKVQERRVRCFLDGVEAKIDLPETTDKLDIASQLKGISPNFVHSQDAAALVLCVNRAMEAGDVSAFTAVHDAFGSHAASMGAVSRHLRQAFVDVHSQDALVTYRNACLSMMVAEIASRKGIDPFEASQEADALLPQVPEMGELRLDDVKESQYFFA